MQMFEKFKSKKFSIFIKFVSTCDKVYVMIWVVNIPTHSRDIKDHFNHRQLTNAKDYLKITLVRGGG